ncbi:hypothetical protein ACPW96_17915 [Micromonospora sp. DT81.3]|uniref:hypothetical protein n=1 Tax=Micromonospora sp. DT81.3 TaxID=3416523 RepID=UPI003CEE8F59
MMMQEVLDLAPAMMAAETSNRDLGDPTVLKAAGAWLAQLCKDADCTVVIAASRSAEWIVASAVLTTDAVLHTAATGSSTTGRVMIVEGAVVTGSALYHAAEAARSQGATWVGAAIFLRTRPDLDQLDVASLDLVSNLRSLTQA